MICRKCKISSLCLQTTPCELRELTAPKAKLSHPAKPDARVHPPKTTPVVRTSFSVLQVTVIEVRIEATTVAPRDTDEKDKKSCFILPVVSWI